jgi:ribose transport system substrate-binding protein
MKSFWWRVALGLTLLVCGAGIVGCGSSGTSQTGRGSSSSANVGAAKAFLARYSAKPTPFPVDQPLTKHLAPNQKIAYLQNGTPYAALLGQLFKQAAGSLKAHLLVVNAGGAANSLQSGLASIKAEKPAALLLGGVNLSSLGGGVRALNQAGTRVITSAVFGGKAQGIDADVNGANAVALSGKLLADWTIANEGSSANVIFYTIPELDFTAVETAAFKKEMATNCSACKVQVIDLPLADVGTTAPQVVTTELQSNPGVNVVMFSSMETAEGVPSALKAAGLNVKIGGFAPTPENLQDIQNGGDSVAIGLDTAVMAYTMMDEAVRLSTGQPLTPGEKTQTPVLQVLTKQNLPDNVSKGWLGYPGFAQRFSKVWGE